MEFNKPKQFNILTEQHWLNNLVDSLKLKFEYQNVPNRTHIQTYRNDDNVIVIGYNALRFKVIYDQRIIGHYLIEKYQKSQLEIEDLVRCSFMLKHPSKKVIEVSSFGTI